MVRSVLRLLTGVKDLLLRTDEKDRADSGEERPLRFSVAIQRRNNDDVYPTAIRLLKLIEESRGVARKCLQIDIVDFRFIPQYIDGVVSAQPGWKQPL
jgi:hypothetical protein